MGSCLAVAAFISEPVTAAVGFFAVACIAGWGMGDKPSGRPAEPENSLGLAYPRRRDYLLLALVVCVVAIHGSLRPFRFEPLGLGDAIVQMKAILGGEIDSRSRTDFAVNVVLFVPIGYCLLGALTLDRARVVSWLLGPVLVWAICGALSVAIEFGQLWLPTRYTQLSDVLAQTIGTTAGMLLWLFAGQNVADWVRSFTVGERRKGPFDWLLRAYFVGLLVFSVMPLDLITSPGGLMHKYRSGRVLLIPFAEESWDWASGAQILCDVLVYVPVGMLAATWLTSRKWPARPLGESILLGSSAVSAIEAMQLLVNSRVTSTDDLICGVMGVGVGAVAMRAWRGRDKSRRGTLFASRIARHAWAWLGLAVVYSVCLAALMWWPFEPTADSDLIRTRYRESLRNPFDVLPGASTWETIWFATRRGLLFLPLGGMLAMAVGRLPVPSSIRRVLFGLGVAIVGGAAMAIEMVQVFLPPHLSSSNDVLWSVVGAAVGSFVALWWLCHGQSLEGKTPGDA